jgi:quercetin dioxygenase-like cupin family protein
MKRIPKLVVLAGVIVLVLAGLALATPGVGVLASAVFARGTNAQPLDVQGKAGVTLQTKSGVDFVTQQIVIAPGGTTGWHSHPGPVLVTVKSGELTLVYANEATCRGRTYRAGESFVDRGDEVVHTALNRGTENLELWATYLVPGNPGAPMRIDAPAPSLGTCQDGVAPRSRGRDR